MSIKEVAQKAAVSRMTVSRVMRGCPSVSVETSKRVLRVMKEVGYVPSLAARAMRSKDNLRTSGSLCCALILGADVKMADGFFCDVARAAEEEAAVNGLCLLQSYWQDSFEASWPRLQSIFSVSGLCGAILAGQIQADQVRAIQKHAANVVVIDGPMPSGISVASVESDYVNGARMAMEHLVARGAKRVLVITGPSKNHYFAKALTSAANAVSSNFSKVELIYTEQTAQSGYNIIRERIRQGEKFDGVFGNDETAIGVLCALAELKIRVPEEVKVVGFDDITHSAFTSPPLTTVRIEKTLLGREAVRALVEMTRGSSDSAKIRKVITAGLIVRQSS
ncbi:MAG: LacI family DNA-binding transcriptional regulator [Kiritimatiellae bacterium]|nr:LacI family DNA-binding transcriptional regulator [Kiritimatiellia bacterium]MDD5519652.1 LacI family DNA-binding transcriptional regulator [Kiritimatiellia bacterium]